MQSISLHLWRSWSRISKSTTIIIRRQFLYSLESSRSSHPADTPEFQAIFIQNFLYKHPPPHHHHYWGGISLVRFKVPIIIMGGTYPAGGWYAPGTKARLVCCCGAWCTQCRNCCCCYREQEDAQVLLQLFQWSTHTDNGKCWDCVTFFLAQQQIGWWCFITFWHTFRNNSAYFVG